MKEIIFIIYFAIVLNPSVFAQDIFNAKNSLETFSDCGFDPKLLDFIEIIGLGEPSHGIASINQARSNLTIELIKKQHVKFIIWEESLLTMINVNKEINKPSPNYEKAIERITPFWRTKETIELFKFIHQYNIENPDDKVMLLGMDLASNLALYNQSMNFFKDYISNPTVLERYTKFEKKFRKYKRIKKRDRKKITKIADELMDELKTNKSLYEKHYTPMEIDLMQLIVQNIKYTVGTTLYNMGTRRESLMENNVMAAYHLKKTSDKIVVWAHNAHITKFYENYSNVKTVGERLNDKIGSKYYAIGFEFGAGSYFCYERKYSIAKAMFLEWVLRKKGEKMYEPKTVEFPFYDRAKTITYLHGLNKSCVFFDIQSLNEQDELFRLLNTPQRYHEIGGDCADLEDAFYFETIWSKNFDAIYYIDKVEATIPK